MVSKITDNMYTDRRFLVESTNQHHSRSRLRKMIRRLRALVHGDGVVSRAATAPEDEVDAGHGHGRGRGADR